MSFLLLLSVTVWNPGIPGGIPGDTDPTRPATVWRPSRNPYAGYSVDPARGNDTTDDAAAINDAIAAAGRAATGGAIRIGPSNVTLRGSGRGRTIIHRQRRHPGRAQRELPRQPLEPLRGDPPRRTRPGQHHERRRDALHWPEADYYKGAP